MDSLREIDCGSELDWHDDSTWELGPDPVPEWARPFVSTHLDDDVPAEVEPDWPDPEDDAAPRLTLSELVFAEANRLLDGGSEAHRLMADALAELGRLIKFTEASTVDQFRGRLAVLDGAS